VQAEVIRRKANTCGAAAAEEAAAAAVTRYPLSAELRVLSATLLLELGRYKEAAREARAAVYIDRTLVVAHFLSAAAARRLGDERGERAAFRSALLLCRRAPADQQVPLSDGELAGRMASAAAFELARLGCDVDREGGGAS
jgi:chemotaxis protein methyltransferase CheR